MVDVDGAFCSESEMTKSVIMARCTCGKVALETTGAPITSTICHCSGCQEAGHILEQLPHAPPVLDSEEGTALTLFRKDRVRCVKGSENLREHRLKESSPTRRVVAVCCNSFMFLDFTKGHWVSVASIRLEANAETGDAPIQGRQSAMFILRLMIAWAQMGFRTPTIDYVKGSLSNG